MPKRNNDATPEVEDLVRELVSDAPRLGPEQLDELRYLLRAENVQTERGKSKSRRPGTPVPEPKYERRD